MIELNEDDRKRIVGRLEEAADNVSDYVNSRIKEHVVFAKNNVSCKEDSVLREFDLRYAEASILDYIFNIIPEIRDIITKRGY